MRGKKASILVILGPTGIGKSGLALKVAERINGEILSGDSMQVYHNMDIGTAKVTLEEQKMIPHHLIDIRDISEEYNVVDFCEEANKLIAEIEVRGKVPIIAGGTGLYIQALLEGYQFSEVSKNENFRKELEERAQIKPQSLYQELQEKDPINSQYIDPNNIRRIIRALENISVGKGISREKSSELVFDGYVFGLSMDRNKMYDRINKRVDKMISEGWIDECKKLLPFRSTFSQNALQAIGYKEIFQGLETDGIDTELIDKIKQRTRQFAKRQLTWFRRMEYITWLEIDEEQDFDKLADRVASQWLEKYPLE
jgi:tRNA dimethylallyltransferase